MRDARSIVLALAPVPPADPAGLTSSTRLVADLGYDSLALVELTAALVEELGVDEERAVDVLTVGDVDELAAASASPPA